MCIQGYRWRLLDARKKVNKTETHECYIRIVFEIRKMRPKCNIFLSKLQGNMLVQVTALFVVVALIDFKQRVGELIFAILELTK